MKSYIITTSASVEDTNITLNATTAAAAGASVRSARSAYVDAIFGLNENNIARFFCSVHIENT